MDFKLHQAITHANYAVHSMLDIDFCADHHMSPANGISEARKHLAMAAAELNAYEMKLSPAAKVEAA